MSARSMELFDFCPPPSPSKLNDSLLLKYCFLGFTDPLRASSPLSSQTGGGSIVHTDFLQTAPPPGNFLLFTLST